MVTRRKPPAVPGAVERTGGIWPLDRKLRSWDLFAGDNLLAVNINKHTRVHENNNHTVCREINERIDELTGGLITLCFGGGFGGSGVQLGFEQSVPQALQLPVQTAFTTSKQSTI